MGEAKRRRETAVPTVYHHTSTLRTNLIWMSGVIQVEGKSEGVFHPRLGEIKTDALARRAMKDFPPVAWFTRRIDIPNCLVASTMFGVDKKTGVKKEITLAVEQANAMAMNRLAIGFPVGDIPVIPWSEHAGYATGEGRELNETAIAAGDDPMDWYVSETPINVMKVSEFWFSPSLMKPKLRRSDGYIVDIHRMVKLCRETKGAYIPPTWMKQEQAEALARSMNVPVGNLGR
ncbi:hypothetical protein LRP31_35000 (plasmid) [Mesorhizobium mediterraneum]|uniref:Uncharacterized protein n=1 Tax=Mesorhizobium mediterraneum TaxID=43617 RepID=A0AB36RGZ6_9HYPH|nr:hypothetical protein [Mesorhizobium mediterraneum]PAQ03766.1 hypothetical protein CIT25_02915 [Mesorhizobium mediterraneum]WIW57339.1 hypothetical protein LRP31_35000 [Mesorhizobium mediterraneum]